MRGLACAAAALGLAALASSAPVSASSSTDGPEVECRFSDDRLTEISGLTWSARHDGVYWLHNDSSGGPYLYAVDGTTCRTLARIEVAGIDARDLEAVGTGVDPAGRAVLWLGDIGDNQDSWDEVRLHAVPEPAELRDQVVKATTYRFTYADRPHNAEALLVSPEAPDIWVVTKQLARGAVWQVPLVRGEVATAERVGEVGGLVTDAAMSPDGTRFVIRDYLGADLYDAPVSAAALESGIPVELPRQPQGEAVSFTADGEALLVASESDDALWRVPLPAPGLPGTSASGSPSGPASPTGAPSAAPSAEAGGVSGPAAWLIGGAAILAAVGVAAWATRRLT